MHTVALMSATAPVTVLVPTIGRPRLLDSCLRSLTACRPRPAEIMVLDQSGTEATSELVQQYAAAGVCHFRLSTRGKGRALNAGLRLAAFDFVLITDDDCVVAVDWVAVGLALLSDDPHALFTGRVLSTGDPAATPSTFDANEPTVYESALEAGNLYGNNMGCHRPYLLEIGGFDDVIAGSAVHAASEDNELSYRWLRQGRRVRFEPKLFVWHQDWRSSDQLSALYVGYARGQGMFYGKHLRLRDWTMLRFLARDLHAGARGVAAAVVYGRRDPPDWRRAVFRGLPGGLVAGWRAYGGAERSSRRARTPTSRS